MVAIVATPRPGHAEPLSRRFDVGFLFGGHAFADDGELGATSADAPAPASAALFGARIGVRIVPGVAAELELVAIPTKDDVMEKYAGVAGTRAHARVDLLDLAGGAFDASRLRPFVVAGLGVHTVEGGAPQLRDDTDVCYLWGAGVGYALSDRFALRVDLRHLIVPDRTEDGATHEVEVSAGLAIRLGSTPPPSPPPRIAYVATPPAPQPARQPAPHSAPPSAPTITELTGILFDVRRAEIVAASRPILDRAVEILRAKPQLRVEIAGHTSAEGSEPENQGLAWSRASAVKRYLVERGIAEDRLVIATYGSSRPIADNHTETGRARNRRIELRILDTQAR